MSDNHFDELNYVDQIDYNRRLTKCNYCPGIDKCEQYGIKPVISYRQSVGKWALAGQICGKQKGSVEGTYAELIKEPVILYENDERKSILKELSKGKGGFLYGKTGVGKSTIIYNLAKQFNEQGKDVYVEFANKITTSLRDFKTSEERIKALQDVEILFIDDFARETMTGWVIMNIFNPILQTRIDSHKPTYITCNYSLNELFSMIKKETDEVSAEALIDRLTTIGVHNLKDKNYRVKSSNRDTLEDL